MSDSVRAHRWKPTRLPVPGILQARILEWVAISFSSAWKWKVKMKSLSHIQLLATPWTSAYQAPPSMGFSRQEHWSGLPFASKITFSFFNYAFESIETEINLEKNFQSCCLNIPLHEYFVILCENPLALEYWFSCTHEHKNIDTEFQTGVNKKYTKYQN